MSDQDFDKFVADRRRDHRGQESSFDKNKFEIEIISRNPDIYIETSIKNNANTICPVCHKEGTPKFIRYLSGAPSRDSGVKDSYSYICGSKECVYFWILSKI